MKLNKNHHLILLILLVVTATLVTFFIISKATQEPSYTASTTFEFTLNKEQQKHITAAQQKTLLQFVSQDLVSLPVLRKLLEEPEIIITLANEIRSNPEQTKTNVAHNLNELNESVLNNNNPQSTVLQLNPDLFLPRISQALTSISVTPQNKIQIITQDKNPQLCESIAKLLPLIYQAHLQDKNSGFEKIYDSLVVFIENSQDNFFSVDLQKKETLQEVKNLHQTNDELAKIFQEKTQLLQTISQSFFQVSLPIDSEKLSTIYFNILNKKLEIQQVQQQNKESFSQNHSRIQKLNQELGLLLLEFRQNLRNSVRSLYSQEKNLLAQKHDLIDSLLAKNALPENQLVEKSKKTIIKKWHKEKTPYQQILKQMDNEKYWSFFVNSKINIIETALKVEMVSH